MYSLIEGKVSAHKLVIQVGDLLLETPLNGKSRKKCNKHELRFKQLITIFLADVPVLMYLIWLKLKVMLLKVPYIIRFFSFFPPFSQDNYIIGFQSMPKHYPSPD